MQCGRQWGKTVLSAYLTVRWAALNPNARIYYFCPERKQVKKTFWDKLLRFLPEELVAEDGKNIADLTVTLFNGSKIICDGSDNIDSARGISADLLLIDEFKDFNPEFWFEVGEPSLSATKGRALFLGTPPKRSNKNYEGYIHIANSCKEDKSLGAWHKFPTSVNPAQSLERLNRIKKRLEDMGMIDVWMREYEAEIVEGGADAIFPMFTEVAHCRSRAQLIKDIEKDRHKLDWYVIVDPGTTTCFAALICALNPYNKMLYVLDEVYEKRMEYTSTQMIWPIIEQKMQRWYPGSEHNIWTRVYDEAAAWFANEMAYQYNLGFMATSKAHNKKEEGLSLIKDQMLKRKILINNEDCPNLVLEIKGYMKDDKGEIPKKDDHAIDCIRYMNGACNYMFLVTQEPIMVNDKPRFSRTLEQDMREEGDWDLDLWDILKQ